MHPAGHQHATLPSPTAAAAAVTSPSSSTGTATDMHANDNDDDDHDDDAVCMICLDALRCMALSHAGFAHLVMCRECCAAYDMSRGCPKCRRAVEQVIDVELGEATEL